ncbi:efflux transporter outer membrane subunit [Niveibacterium terrae]|uniref:efflux transporter outer membrane subunit n=1 Tax=Niveibacterium terrae TaxID=3373598 RepID=UPI003A9336E3
MFPTSLPFRCAAAALALLLAGCAVGPDYRRPDVPIAKSWQAPLPHGGQLASLTDWWGRFHDPVLSDLLAAAQADSPTLARASAAIAKARATQRSSASAWLPSLSANASSTQAGTKAGIGASPTVTTGGGLDASWEIDLFGGVRRSVESARALSEARVADWHDARVSLAAEVATDYVDYRACELKLAAYRDEAKSQRETERLTRLSATAGFAASADADLAQASAASAEATATAQQAECDLTVKSLVALTGFEEVALRGKLAAGSGLPSPDGLAVASVPASLLTSRPDIVSAERALASASADIGIAEAARWPGLTLSGAISATAVAGAASLPWSFGPSLSLPIFQGGALKAKKEGAEAAYQSALADYRQTVRSAVKEVEQALVRLDSSARREADSRTSAEGYRRYFVATEQHWKAGGASLLDLETARRSALGAEIALVELQQNRIDYWIALYKAMGGGWQGLASSAQGEKQ